MKKVLIIVSIIVVIFVGISVLTNYQQKQKSAGNPFGKDKIHTETQKQLDDPLYQNVITPDELEEKLANEETATIYFYQSTCPACKVTSPVVVPMAEEMGIDLQLYNLLEFEEGWNKYDIRVTPTIVHFVNGKEVNRIEEFHENQEVFSDWFEQTLEETPSE